MTELYRSLPNGHFLFVCLSVFIHFLPRERYAFVVTPLIVNAQRRLLERISSFGGPAVPQPHHIKTKEATGKEVAHIHMHKDQKIKPSDLNNLSYNHLALDFRNMPMYNH